MTATAVTSTVTSPDTSTCTPAQRITRSLLGYGVLAGVVFEASIVIQGLTRHGFRSVDGTAGEAVVTAAGGRTPQPYATAADAPTAQALQETLGMWTITVQSARLRRSSSRRRTC